MNARRQHPPRGVVEEWMRHARSDLSYGRLGRSQPDLLPEQICFHAQQSVEKALKALLIEKEVAFPTTHDLEQLLDLLRPLDLVFPVWIDDLLDLTPFAVETRYPGLWEPVSEDECDRALELAGMTLDWVRSLIGGAA